MMSNSTQTFEKENNQVCGFWGGLFIGAAKTVGRALTNRYLLSSENDTIQFIGPINQNNEKYINTENYKVALYINSVNEIGGVTKGHNNHIIFEPKGTKKRNEVDSLLKNNLAGDISWMNLDPNERDGFRRNFIDIKRWNGEQITLFSFDDDEQNDLTIHIDVENNELIVRNQTDKHKYQLEIVLIDSNDSTINLEIELPSNRTESVTTLSKDFKQSMPINRLFIKAKVKTVN